MHTLLVLIRHVLKNGITKLLPTWYKDIDPKRYYAVMTDDFDSYFSYQRLNTLFGLEVGGFYSFESGLWVNQSITEGKEPIHIDLCITKGKTFDNHYSFITNPHSVNPNIIPRNYYQKYNGSTLAVIMSLYGGIDSLDYEQLMTLLAVDGFYIGYYKNNGQYRDVNLYWFKQLEITKHVLPILELNTMDSFADFHNDHQLREEIFINNNGYLECAVSIQLPKEPFSLIQPIEKTYVSKHEAQSLYAKDNDSIFVSNETYKDKYVLNLKRKV